MSQLQLSSPSPRPRQFFKPPKGGMASVVQVASAPYEKKFAAQVIHHHRNFERDMLVALTIFVRKHGRAALGFRK